MTTHENDHTESERITRRGSLLRLAGIAATAGGVGAWRLDAAQASASGPLAVSSGLVTCVLTPELTEGPYYVSGEKLRRDITEGKPGTALLLGLTVLNASTCKPIKNAAVDIWHCDALGVYSGAVANNAGTNFLRGVQRTNAKGIATFKTLYPGWYQGRAVHIHVKVHVGGNVVHTGQLFFNDAATDAVYKRTPYSRRPNRATRNTDDSIYVNGGSKSLLKITRLGKGYSGAITMGVQTT
jgi:protocatechuate 3,4-dioxygenase beta subunit